MNESISSNEAAEMSGESGAQHQNIARAALILEALAGCARQGLRLTDVSRITGLSKTVAHRGLAGLVAHGMATYENESARFFLGDRLFAWVGRAGEWNLWNSTQYVMTCSTLSAIIESIVPNR